VQQLFTVMRNSALKRKATGASFLTELNYIRSSGLLEHPPGADGGKIAV